MEKTSTFLNNYQHIAEAVSRVRKNDQMAMRFLYTSFAKSMLNLSFRITNDLTLSEDIIQEAFLKSFKEIGHLKDPSKYGTWLKRIVANQSISYVRKTMKFEVIDEELVVKIEDVHWYKKLDFAQIEEAILSLPNGCRQVLTLYLLDGFKHKEIASMLNTSESNAKSQYSYAKKLLRTKLKSHKYA